jgi:transposase
MFVDYAGQTMPLTDRLTGLIHHAQIFVAALGASNYQAVPGANLAETWLSKSNKPIAMLPSKLPRC